MAKNKRRSGQRQPGLCKNSIIVAEKRFLLPTAPKQALKILHEERFFTPEAVAEVFNPYRENLSESLPPLEPPNQSMVPYTAKTLRQRAIGKDWLLLYSYGLSLAELCLMFVDGGRQPRFCPCCDKKWWMLDHRRWAQRRGIPGYYLINLCYRQERFSNLAFDLQNWKLISEYGLKYERAPLSLLAEAYFAAKLLTGEELLSKKAQWGDACYDLEKGVEGRVMLLSSQLAEGHAPNSLVITASDPGKGDPRISLYVTKNPEMRVVLA